MEDDLTTQVEILNDEKGPFFLVRRNAESFVVRVEFTPRIKIGGRSDLLAKAVGYKKSQKLYIVDATAGLCRDSFHFASLGCRVLALEQNQKVFSVVWQQLENYKKNKSIDFSILNVEAGEFLRSASRADLAQVVYLDPMFSEVKRKSKPAKESQLLQALNPIPTADEELKLLSESLNCASKRVVVKRPYKSPWMANQKPNFSIVGKSVRYDVYLIKSS